MLLGIGALLLVVVLVVGLFVSRQRTLSLRVGAFSCLVRPDPAPEQTAPEQTAPQQTAPEPTAPERTWTAGTAQYGVNQLMWWRTLSLSPRPARSWSRSTLTLLEREPLDETDDAGRPMLRVRCRHGTEAFWLRMSVPAFAGLLSWLESAPRDGRVV